MIKSRLTNFYNELQLKSDKGTDHDYINGYYDLVMSEHQHLKISLLEIGVLNGHSINLWQKFFTHPDCYILGVDIKLSDSALKTIDAVWSNETQRYLPGFRTQYDDKENHKAILYESNAYSKEFANQFLDNTFDFVIDDGPHTLESQIDCIDLYLPKIKMNTGRLIIEDIQSKSDLEAIEDKLNEPNDMYKIMYKVYDLTQNKGRYDDIIIEIKKRF